MDYRYVYGQPVKGDVEGSVCLRDDARQYFYNEITDEWDSRLLYEDLCVRIAQPVRIA